MKIGLFFGSFNPIHIGHLFVAEMALDKAGLDEIKFIISPASPYKMDTGELSSKEDRYNMAEEILGENEKFSISNVEFDMPTPSYTADTLHKLRESHPEDEFYLICGTDVYVDIPKWHLGREVIEAVNFIVYPRNTSSKYSPEEMKSKTIWLDGVPILEISATFIRNQIKNKKSTKYILKRKTREYIENNKLYQ